MAGPRVAPWSASPATEPDVLTTIAADFGISESCLNHWLRTADAEDGIEAGTIDPTRK